MDKTILLDKYSTQETRTLFAHILDLSARRDGKNIITSGCFLSETEKMQAEKMLQAEGIKNYIFYGGYAEAERTCPVFLPEYYQKDDLENDPKLSEITYLIAEVNKFDEGRADFTHRDCLGSLMALGIERSSIGDLIPEGGKAILIVKSDIATYITENLGKIGRYPVTFHIEEHCEIHKKIDYEEKTDTVSNMRLDAVTATVYNLSRTAAQENIDHGLVAVNGFPVQKIDKIVNLNDKITLRGKGKIQITEVEEANKKGRVRFYYKKYM